MLGFGIIFLFTYIIGLFDDAFTQVYEFDTWYEAIIASFKYYFYWGLPYWWLIILIGTVVLGLIFYGIGEGIGKLRKPT